MAVTQEHIEYALSDDIWSFGNQILYELCSKHPEHNDPKVITAKIWLIGRSYAAAIERRRNVEEQVNGFYEDQVVPALASSGIDAKINNLRKFNQIEDQSLVAILETHKHLVDVFYGITDQNKRSLASKYLHFHLPNLFYLYDSWAHKCLRVLKPRYRASRDIAGDFDEVYSKFALKLLDLQEEIERLYGYKLTPRRIDRILLKASEETIAP